MRTARPFRSSARSNRARDDNANGPDQAKKRPTRPVLFDLRTAHAASAEFRTIAGQIEFWAKVGKAALDNPDLPIDFVRDVLIAKGEPREAMTPFSAGQFRG